MIKIITNVTKQYVINHFMGFYPNEDAFNQWKKQFHYDLKGYEARRQYGSGMFCIIVGYGIHVHWSTMEYLDVFLENGLKKENIKYRIVDFNILKEIENI